MFRLEDLLIGDPLRETTLREMESLRTLLPYQKIIMSIRVESYSMVAVVVHSQVIIASGSVVFITNHIEFLRVIAMMLVWVVFISLMHMEPREVLVEIPILVDNVVIKKTTILSVHLIPRLEACSFRAYSLACM